MNGPLCRWCGARIRWMSTENGRNMPLDPDPTPSGNVALVDTPDGPRARTLKAAELLEWKGRLWMPHGATCPTIRTRTGTKRTT